jgi:hypothetical protein
MKWEIEFTEVFRQTWDSLTVAEQEAINERVGLLEEQGPSLGRPYADHIKQSVHSNMKELRASTGRAHLRVLYAFDPRRTAILLILGDKSPDDPNSPNWTDWYDYAIPIADDLFSHHLNTM